MSPAARTGRVDLGGYVEVKDRIRLFYEQFPDGRLTTANVQVSTEPDGKARVWVEAAAYRTVDDPLPARGYSWMELPGSTNFTRGSELENTETSAWGRAIGALGIGIDKSIASAQEVQNKERDAIADAAIARQGIVTGPVAVDPENAGLIGTAEKGKGDADFELRLEATHGHVLVFRLTEGRKGWKVIARGLLAEMVAEYREGIEGQRVTCWGAFSDESFIPKDTERKVTYQVLNLTRLKVGSLDLTAPDVEASDADEDFDGGWLDKVPA